MEDQSLPNFQQEIVKLEEARKIYQMGRQEVRALAEVVSGPSWDPVDPAKVP